MKYVAFEVENYRAIEERVKIDLSKSPLIPIVGINECGKTTILQAIYCFDYVNDGEYEGRHLENVKNLYKTDDSSDTIIRATLQVTLVVLQETFDSAVATLNKAITAKAKAEDDDAKKSAIESKLITKPFPFSQKSFNGLVQIERNLSNKKYQFGTGQIPDDYPAVVIQAWARELVRRMPYILYNDDFMDRPPNSVDVPKQKPESLTGWLAIYERLFKMTNEKYSLFGLAAEPDSRRRDSILSDVKAQLNKTLTKDWTKLSVIKNDLTIDLKFTLDPSDDADKNHVLDVQVIEKIGDRERFFNVIDRSKGFLWFFNFVMKLVFNPKRSGGEESNTVYLLDEPGSYLHQAAQEKLCIKLAEISKKHGSVIFCTHSHKLLSPEYIPLNSIYIVEKDSKKRINVTPLPAVKTTIENTSALQPVLEALQMPTLEATIDAAKIIAVEGIFDKFAIELLLTLEPKTFLLPGTGADSIVKNIQYLNAFNKDYVAIWDNDKEGIEARKRAVKFFGVHEAERFDLLPSQPNKKRRMEEMFAPGDIAKMGSSLGLTANINYESVISTLYYSDAKVKSPILSALSSETKQNFKVLESIIDKRFENSRILLESANPDS